jgi:hypothetical protein
MTHSCRSIPKRAKNAVQTKTWTQMFMAILLISQNVEMPKPGVVHTHVITVIVIIVIVLLQVRTYVYYFWYIAVVLELICTV